MQRHCDHCGGSYEAKSSNSKFCSRVECKRERERERKRRPALTVASAPGEPIVEGAVSAAARSVLTSADRLASPAGSAAIVLAHRIDANADSGSAMASLVREYRAAMTEAMAGVPLAPDRVDEIRAQREKRQRASS